MTQLLSHIFYALFGRLKMYIVIFCGMADSGHVMFNFFLYFVFNEMSCSTWVVQLWGLGCKLHRAYAIL
jgi:hypothetical protein